MKILGIETSCDETSVSVVKNGQLILSNVIATSLKDHQKYGGIIPEIASRKQLELINTVTHRALETARVPLKQIDAIAVTSNPGLIGSLLVGISFAQSLSYALKKPLVEVNHITAHLYANFLRKIKQENKIKELPRLPAIGLVVSGGHSSIFHIKNFENFLLLGQTRDDAAGEAYDKVARILKLGYPGGPVIDRISKKGINKKIHFPCANLSNSFDFSFSGIKTSVYYHVKKQKELSSSGIQEIAYAFQKSVVGALVKKTILACESKHIKTLVVGGGVAANSELRKELHSQAKKKNINVFFPDIDLCMDNAAMIAGLGYHLIKK
ncbi:MAG: tRNA (adenosine(37)-N6)-threonylcarbamoyltransferase complex transferase subunit TsaD [Candidatus Omnitrophica bacterium]|nr:tRNA (adenosine(37)-N6)-threonylcarbamoyltransferase complex transferase subunit TsaD [Candidatus Omnitrophota bacterium]